MRFDGVLVLVPSAASIETTYLNAEPVKAYIASEGARSLVALEKCWPAAASEIHSVVLTVPARKTVLDTRADMLYVTKSPLAIRDYVIDWSADLGTDTIASAQPVITQNGITAALPSIQGSTTRTRISGGTAGQSYLLIFQITGAGGQTYAQAVTMVIAY